MSGITDFHSHILPGIDDGSKNVEESVALLQMEARQGIRRVIATPHFYAHHDTPEHFLRKREAAWETLRRAMEGHPELPEVILGAEVYYFPGMSESDALSQLTIGKNRFILLEMPQPPWTEAMYREIEAIYVRRGIMPVIAHIDRYIGPFRTHGIPKRLEKLPVLVQANADFFLQRSTARMAMQMLRTDRIHLLGSDCHDPVSRKPNLGDALTLIGRRLGEGAADSIRAYERIVIEMNET